MIRFALALLLAGRAPALHGIRVAANNFFWKVRREGRRLARVRLWRELGRPEAGLVDARAPASPTQTRLLASIPDLMGPGRSAEMTYYETPAGAKVFAAGSLNFAASIGEPVVSRLVENVWVRLSRP